LTGATINQRVAIVDRALRIAFPGAPGQIAPGFQQTYWQRAPMGIGKPRLALSRLRVKTPKRYDSIESAPARISRPCPGFMRRGTSD
jgi:hypothetical protein